MPESAVADLLRLVVGAYLELADADQLQSAAAHPSAFVDADPVQTVLGDSPLSAAVFPQIRSHSVS